MTKHRHYDLIVAKAANMDLVVFIKLGDQWQVTGCHDNQVINIASHYDYFLCLHQHKEACLHWLKGGEIECLEGGTWLPFRRSHEWKKEAAVMNPTTKIRIKPKKEKRWIAYNRTTGSTYGTFDTKEVCEGYHPEHQHIEIEAEV
ncbi:hypothetical protein NVP1023O_54 [Vibrio phage 1.023.O._10N.222.51.B4]|nr:hypothetical protein NVP1023O_54 [Vibrio phage 1.023.O._10N.222.51.B4]